MQNPNPGLSLALAQLNLCVGDISGNLVQILQAVDEARQQHADVVLFPELSVTSYAPEDLVFRVDFLHQVQQALAQIAESSHGITVVIGAPVQADNGVHNAAYVYRDGEQVGYYAKQALPNYRVFDEKRWFVAGSAPLLVDICGHQIGILICEDIWHQAPAAAVKAVGAEAILVLNGSPYRSDKLSKRLQVVQDRVAESGLPFAYCNLVGGQDHLLFDGDSMVVDAMGRHLFAGPLFESGVYLTHLPIGKQDNQTPSIFSESLRGESLAHIYQALVMGLKDYVHKNGFTRVVLGLSGGIDSALTMAIAVDALGQEHVDAVMMPFQYTAEISLDDARAQAETMGVHYQEIPIAPAYDAFMALLASRFEGMQPNVTEENLQARIRGMLLMTISNKQGQMLLSTSNKSESAVGYTTLYGDMCGGYAPIKDVFKVDVYRLARYRNGVSPVIPERVITRPPSAELAPDQVDQDSLPDYEVLDEILERIMIDDEPLKDIIAAGFDQGTVKRVANLLWMNQYKRFQAPPGTRVSARSFDRDWRHPLTSKWRHQLPI